VDGWKVDARRLWLVGSPLLQVPLSHPQYPMTNDE
jgi:hypothetical protein